MKKFNKYALFTSLLICIYHLLIMIHHSKETDRARNAGLTSLADSHSVHLHFLHFLFLLLFVVFLIFVCRKGLLSEIISLVSSFFALGLYYWWYFERYDYLRAWGIKEGTADYQIWLAETGILRGALAGEYVVFVLTVILTVFALIRVFERVKSKNTPSIKCSFLSN